jgi:hypothetical protein
MTILALSIKVPCKFYSDWKKCGPSISLDPQWWKKIGNTKEMVPTAVPNG